MIFVWFHYIGFALNGPLARYTILLVANAPGMLGTFSPLLRFCDPDMHHGTCMMHLPWCMWGSLTSSFLWSRPQGKMFLAFLAHVQPAILRIWQEAHVWICLASYTPACNLYIFYIIFCLAPDHNINQSWVIVNKTHRNKLQFNLNETKEHVYSRMWIRKWWKENVQF